MTKVWVESDITKDYNNNGNKHITTNKHSYNFKSVDYFIKKKRKYYCFCFNFGLG